MSAGGAEREARVGDTTWHDKAQQVWDEIFDDDECCEGHPEGVEYHEEPVVKRLAAALARCANEARLEALKQAALHYPNEIGNMAYCRCGWSGQNWSEHIRALKVDNAWRLS